MRRGEITKKILEYLKSGVEASPKKIAEETGLNYNTVRGALQRLARKGLVKKCGRGIYSLA